jgi:hypothetical protein
MDVQRLLRRQRQRFLAEVKLHGFGPNDTLKAQSAFDAATSTALSEEIAKEQKEN